MDGVASRLPCLVWVFGLRARSGHEREKYMLAFSSLSFISFIMASPEPNESQLVAGWPSSVASLSKLQGFLFTSITPAPCYTHTCDLSKKQLHAFVGVNAPERAVPSLRVLAHLLAMALREQMIHSICSGKGWVGLMCRHLIMVLAQTRLYNLRTKQTGACIAYQSHPINRDKLCVVLRMMQKYT
jgi:hypothetical protein